MSRTVFLQLYQVYRDAFGDAYPQRDPINVFKVLEECASPLPTTQVAITAATGVNSGEVNKIVDKAWQKGWVHREETRTSSGAKMVTLTAEGRRVLTEFEQRCLQACEAAVAQHSVTPRQKVSRRATKRHAQAAATDADIDDLVGSNNKQG